MAIAVKYECNTIIFPCISTGYYGFPMSDAALIAIKTANTMLECHESLEIWLAVFNDLEQHIYKSILH